MPGPVVSNTSCLIALEQIDRLDLLRDLFSSITVPHAVADEWATAVPAWIDVRTVTDQAFVATLRDQLGRGEAEAIVLALESSADLLIIDDKRGRQVADRHPLQITGTVGVILAAKAAGLISGVSSVLDELVDSGFRLSDAIIEKARLLAGE